MLDGLVLQTVHVCRVFAWSIRHCPTVRGHFTHIWRWVGSSRLLSGVGWHESVHLRQSGYLIPGVCLLEMKTLASMLVICVSPSHCRTVCLYFCFNCSFDLDRVLNIPHPVPLHHLWPWPKFRLADCMLMLYGSQFESNLHQS